jgi:PIN domain nuclease of toxin-antitoxin system
VARRAFLDTHIALWLASGDPKLSKALVKDINNSSETAVSAVSIAELEIKASAGKLRLPTEFEEVFREAGIKIEPFGIDAALQFRRFPALAKHDPFDRMILAQASAKSNTVLFTADRVIASLGLDWVRDCS